jgi:hypothetical protein
MNMAPLSAVAGRRLAAHFGGAGKNIFARPPVLNPQDISFPASDKGYIRASISK